MMPQELQLRSVPAMPAVPPDIRRNASESTMGSIQAAQAATTSEPSSSVTPISASPQLRRVK
jgi:hypothetical protein